MAVDGESDMAAEALNTCAKDPALSTIALSVPQFLKLNASAAVQSRIS